MASLTQEQQNLIRDFGLGMVATIAPDGAPAVSPKGTFLVLDDTRLGFADIRSPGTIRNLRQDPRVEVTFSDPFARKAVRVAGRADIFAKETGTFADFLPRWAALWPDLAPRVRALVVIEIGRVQTLLTPPYDDGATEAEMIALYKTKYSRIYP